MSIFRQPGKGRGVCADKNYDGGQIIEECEVIKLDRDERYPQNLYQYLYFFPEAKSYFFIALGDGSLYNWSEKPNATAIFLGGQIHITATRDIRRGEEICLPFAK